jgi:hypothetical protein
MINSLKCGGGGSIYSPYWLSKKKCPVIGDIRHLVSYNKQLKDINQNVSFDEMNGFYYKFQAILSFKQGGRIFKLLRSPRIVSKEPIPPRCECVAWRAATTTLFLLGS